MSTKPSNLPKTTATYITVPQETFNNILEYVSTGKIENIEVNYKEEAWENIPNIVPKSVFFLNHKLKKLQGQCKDTEKQIAQILSDSFMAGIKKELQNEKDKLGNFEENIHKEIESILKKFDLLDEVNKARNVLEEKDKVEEFYFHKFFKEEEVGAKRIREQKYLEIPQDGKWNEEAEELRRFNMKQLWYIVNKMLDQSCLNVKVSDMDGQMERMEKYFEEKMQKQFDELNTKCINLDKKIDIEKIALKKAFEKRDDEIFAYVENEIVGRLIEDESAIKTTVDIMEELKEDIDENRNFREKANERFEKMFKQNKDFFNTFEKKIVFYDENFEMMKTKTDQKLEDFRGQIDERFEVLKNETKEHVNFMNAEISRTMEENHKKYIENIEKLMSKTTKDLFALDFETKRVLENFRFEINKSGSEVSNKCQALDTKLDNFISTYIGFEVYAKTKIEPAFNNEAKVHALESRFGEHEEYVSNSTLLIRNILKKLIYAVQKNNLGQLKWLEDEEGSKERKSMGTPSSALITEVRDSNAIGSINTLHEREDTFKQTYHQSWGRRLNSGAGFRKSGERFVNPLIHIDGSHNSDATGATLPGTAKSQKRNQSLDTDRVNLLKEEPTPTPKNKEFDSVLHKRLEVLRKALTDANFISQKYNDTVMRDMTNQNKDKPPKEVAPRNSFMTYYKDINLVKITSQGTKRKFSLNKSLNQPNSEFGDMHLFNDSIDAGDKKL